jgi:isocitrate dehydrogenase
VWTLLQLILPFVDVELKYYDLGILNRDATDDRLTFESAEDTLKYELATYRLYLCAILSTAEMLVHPFLSGLWLVLIVSP